MQQTPTQCAALALITVLAALPREGVAQAGPETQRCLSREQLEIEPIFSACPPLVDEASVSDASFVSKLYLYGGFSTYSIRWQGPSYFHQDDFNWNEETGAYEGFCGTRFCELYPPAWVQQEHWNFLVGTLLAEDVGPWTYSELRDGEVFQSRNFDVRGLDLQALSGTDQVGLADSELAEPLVLQLTSFEGTGVEGEVIGWSITGPKGAKGASLYGIGSGSESDANGIDRAFIRLGSKPGTYTLTLNNRRVVQDAQPSFVFTAIDDIADTDPVREHPDYEEGVGRNQARQCDQVGNPITLSLGNKFQREVDREASGLSPVEFVRFHNSLGFLSRSFGNYWTHSYDRYVEIPADPRLDPVKVVRPDGKKINFFWDGSGFEPYPGVYSALERTPDGWRYTDENRVIETFDAEGLLRQITELSGMRQVATQDSAGRLLRIESSLGDGLDFSYDREGRLASVTDSSGRSWTYRYDALGRLAFVDRPDSTTRQYHYEDLRHAYALTGITLENGRRHAHYAYDEQGRAIASWHAGGANRVDVQYEADGDRVVLDPLGNATVYQTRIEYKRGFLEAISGPVCSQGCGETDTQYHYDADGNLIRKIAHGVVTEFGAYDADGQPGYVVQALGTAQEQQIEYTYDPGFRNRISRITEPSVFAGATKVTTRTYDAAGGIVEEAVAGFDPIGQPVSRTVTWTRDGPYGQVTAVDGPRTDVADVTRYEYYADTASEGANRGRLRAIVDPNGIRIRDEIVYSATGKVLSERRPNGLILQYDYDSGSDRIVSVTESGGALFNRTRWAYYPTGDVGRIILDDEAGNEIVTQFSYDDARRLYLVESRVGGGPFYDADQRIRFTFDAAGNVRAEERWSRDTASVELTIQRVFDAYNRLDRVSQGGVTEDFDFNPDGTLAAWTDGNLDTTRYGYDAFKRLTSTERFGQVTTRLAYDVHGNTISVTDPENHTTHYLYDDLGNRLRLDSPDTGQSTYEYNEAGQIVGHVDNRGQRSQFAYDAGGRLTGVDREGFEYDVAYEYEACPNGTGRLCGASTGWGHATSYAWNGLGEIAKVTTAAGQLGYTHGPQGALTSIEYPSGRQVHFSLDTGGLVRQIRMHTPGLGESVLVDEVRYSPLNRPISWRLANGLEAGVELDGRHRPVNLGAPGALSWLASGYDRNDNLQGLIRDGAAVSFAYDSQNRLVGAESSNVTLGYSYDDVGNRLSRTTDGFVEVGNYEAGSNRLTAFGDRQYVLDPNGNTTSVATGPSAVMNFLYSPHDRLVEIVDGVSMTGLATYRYDSMGQRVEKVTPERTRRFVYGLDGELLAVLDGSNRVLHEYVYLGGQAVVDLGQVPEMEPQQSPQESIIDTDQADVIGANWQSKRSDYAIGGTFLQNRRRDDRGVYWYLDDTGVSGAHDVFVRWLNPEGDGTRTRYSVRVLDDEGTGYDSANIDVNHADKQEGDWVLLGNFDIKPRHDSLRQSVRLTGFANQYGWEGAFLEADAVKLIPTFIPPGASDITFIHGDHLGTPQAATDESGQVIWRASYRPFGRADVDEDADGDGVRYELNLRFRGQYYDAESGLHYNYFRTYDPDLGRYLESDPVGLAGGPNTYSYVAANPIVGADPLGLFQMCHRDLLLPIPYARHCYVRFEDGSTSSFSQNGVNPDGDPSNPDTVCTASQGGKKDRCIERAMQQCLGSNYNFFRFNCCHCVEQALKECGAFIPPSEWPNWPINPGPQPGEPGYTPNPVYDPTLGG